jgi:hypothetical protein
MIPDVVRCVCGVEKKRRSCPCLVSIQIAYICRLWSQVGIVNLHSSLVGYTSALSDVLLLSSITFKLSSLYREEDASLIMDVDLSKAEDAQQKGESVTLSLFSLINQARNEHGLRQQDFKRYRHFCSTKLHHLRETMNKTHVDKPATRQNSKKNQSANNKKQLSKKQKLKAQSAAVQSANSKGKGHVFVRKSIAVEEVKDDR